MTAPKGKGGQKSWDSGGGRDVCVAGVVWSEKKMADLMRCNICFRQPGRETSRLSITNCGHVVCEVCLQKGKKGECGVCRSHCRTIFLSNETDSDIKMLFMDINVLCGKYSKEFTQILEFQDSHRRRLLAHYKGKIAKLEETVKELTKQFESLRSQYKWQPSSSGFMNMGSENHGGLSPNSISSSQLPNSRRVEPINLAPSAPKKNLTIAGPTRLSLISPPKGGHMGHVPFQSNISGSLRPTMSSSPLSSHHQLSQSASQADRVPSGWELQNQRFPNRFPQTPLSSQSSGVRQPIMLANILKRHH